MITRLSSQIADFIRNNNDQAASKEVLMFSIGIVLNTLLVTLTVLGVSAITGHFIDAAIILFSYVVLRFVSGGMHLSTSTLCNAFSIGLFLILVHLPVSYWYEGMIMNCIAAVIVLFNAPTQDMMQLNWFGPKYTIHFKIIALMIVLINFWIQSPTVAIAFLTQALTLLKPAYKFAELLKGGESQ